MAGGPGREGGPGDPRVARMDYDPQIVPLPYGTKSGDPYRNYPDDGPCPGYGAGGPYGQDPDGDYDLPGRPPTAAAWRVLRWLLGLVLALLMLSVIAFGVLFALTPSVANAPTLARAIATAPARPTRDQRCRRCSPSPWWRPRTTASTPSPGWTSTRSPGSAAARITGHGDQGGATLYQQLAKMLYTSGQSGFSVEVKQVMLGVKLDLAYSKARILRMYADIAYFGHGYYGLAQASCGYFGTGPAGLTLPEAATLAGLVQGPSADDPIGHYARARAREAHVLGRLVVTGKITQAQATAAYAQRLRLVGGSGTPTAGANPEFAATKTPASPCLPPSPRLARRGVRTWSAPLLGRVPRAGGAGAVTGACAPMIPGSRSVAFRLAIVLGPVSRSSQPGSPRRSS